MFEVLEVILDADIVNIDGTAWMMVPVRDGMIDALMAARDGCTPVILTGIDALPLS